MSVYGGANVNYKIKGNSTTSLSPSRTSTYNVPYYQSGTVTLSESYYNMNAGNNYNRLRLNGNSKANSIVAGSGGGTLWGGNGNVSDTLVGGSGTDVFIYGSNEGNDVFNNVSSTDTVKLSNLYAYNISGYSHTNNSVSVSFRNGNTLTVNDTGVSAKFQLASGSTWKFTHSTNSLSRVW